MIDNLKRVEYGEPPISKAVAQVVLSWSQAEMLEICNDLEPEANAKFPHVEPIITQELKFNVTGQSVIQSKTQQSSGLRCVQGPGIETIVGQNGIVCIHQEPYLGREELMNGILWWLDRVEKRSPGIEAVRVSTLVENQIAPPANEVGQYRIEGFFVPRFELADPRLNHFQSFSHDVFLDMRNVTNLPIRCRVKLASGANGVALSIDVLDDTAGPLGACRDRLLYVKNLETHVFESCITDATRSLYAPRG